MTVYQEYLDDLLGSKLQGPIFRDSDFVGLEEGARDYAFIASSWVMLRLLGQGPHLENHWSNPFFFIAMDYCME